MSVETAVLRSTLKSLIGDRSSVSFARGRRCQTIAPTHPRVTYFALIRLG
jgi:hypothetical protein